MKLPIIVLTLCSYLLRSEYYGVRYYDQETNLKYPVFLDTVKNEVFIINCEYKKKYLNDN